MGIWVWIRSSEVRPDSDMLFEKLVTNPVAVSDSL